MRKQVLATVASEYARAALLPDTLTSLGQFADAPSYSGGDPLANTAITQLVRMLESRPAKERYETLRAWTMPTGERRLVRMLHALIADQPVPAVFEKAAQKNAPKPSAAATEVVGTGAMLVDAAREAGMLESLAADLKPLVESKEKIENARPLAWLVALATGQGESVRPQLEERLAELVKENENVPTAPVRPGTSSSAAAAARSRLRVFPHAEYQIARALIRDDNSPLFDLGLSLYDALLERTRLQINQSMSAKLRVERAEALARRVGSKRPLASADAGLKQWHPAGYSSAYATTAIGSAPKWVTHQGHVAQLAGPDTSALFFDVPLGGTYEFQVDTYGGRSAEGSIMHYVIMIEPADNTARDVVLPGRNDTISHAWKFYRPDQFNRITVKVSPEVVRYIVNDHLFFEDKQPSRTSPWVGLVTQRGRPSVWKNLTLNGDPTIPAEVSLSDADRLDGWNSSFYNETQPPRSVLIGRMLTALSKARNPRRRRDPAGDEPDRNFRLVIAGRRDHRTQARHPERRSVAGFTWCRRTRPESPSVRPPAPAR